ncbi:hypothetical protein Daus18300_002137 [Diaporthe australafricana]|uniref:SH3 domain-containing protein n=1 Tax=Diaporthe australafricana TaxID=127596 RepID=A0ABR3XR85_9PEZI
MVMDELNELLLNLQTCIDHLFGLSILIRRLRPRGKVQQLSSFQSSVAHQWDVVTVMDKFPKVKQTPWLAKRLGRLTDQRRQFFTYRQKHRNQLGNISKRDEVSSGDDNATLGAATTVATTFKEGDVGDASPSKTFGSQDLQLNRRQAATAATSFVSNYDDSGQMGRRIPELPSMAVDGVKLGYGESFECPYCRTIQSCTNRLSWKKHVFSDLQPYVCTFENCSATPFSTRNDWFQHEMDSHRRKWECILCDNSRPTYSQKAQLATHFEEYHQHAVSQNQMDLILGACETQLTMFDASACPLCSEWEPPLEEAIHMREFRRHLARHLQQISLEALPLYLEGLEIQEDFDEGDEVEWKKATVLRDFNNHSNLKDVLNVSSGDDVLILDDEVDKDWWQVRAEKTGEEGKIPSSYVRITGTTIRNLGKSGPDYSNLRMWGSRSESFEVSAQLLRLEDDQIVLLKENGVQVKVPRDKLSARDAAYVAQIKGSQLDSEDNTDSEVAESEEDGPDDGT